MGTKNQKTDCPTNRLMDRQAGRQLGGWEGSILMILFGRGGVVGKDLNF
jgi:hypothetical protein